MTERCFQRSSCAVWRASERFLVAAVPPARPRSITGSAALVWAFLADPVSVDELVVRLADATEFDEHTIRADVVALLDQLVTLGLVDVQS